MWLRQESIGSTVLHQYVATGAWRVLLCVALLVVLVRLRPWRFLGSLARGRRG